MDHTAHQTYRGWEITVRCTHTAGPPGRPGRYVAVAEAALLPTENPADWVDPRIQQLSTSGRTFGDGEACVLHLLAETQQLIDALRK